jgi:hypothetical protein
MSNEDGPGFPGPSFSANRNVWCSHVLVGRTLLTKIGDPTLAGDEVNVGLAGRATVARHLSYLLVSSDYYLIIARSGRTVKLNLEDLPRNQDLSQFRQSYEALQHEVVKILRYR